jgi:predicted RNase H-like nuclease (RuvC/YqgF family)
MARKQHQGRKPRASERGRWSSKRKAEIVIRILKGEDLDALSRELGVSTARLAQWRDEFFAAGQAALQTRQPDHRDEEINRLKAKIGDQTMTIELLEGKIDILEDGLRPQPRRSSR